MIDAGGPALDSRSSISASPHDLKRPTGVVHGKEAEKGGELIPGRLEKQ